MAIYSIKDLEKLSGIKAHTIRIWEQRYGIISPKRTSTNIRYYQDSDLKLLLNIALLNKNGYRISKIAQMSKEELLEKVSAISEVSNEQDNQLDTLTISMIEMDEYKFDRIIDASTAQLGFEDMVLQVMYPFLDKLGLLWLTGSINPVQENFICYLIRQKIIAAIDGLPMPPKDSTKFLVYLPEGETQELSLLLLNYLLKARQIRVIYLGPGIGLTDVKDALLIHKPEYVYTLISETFNEMPIQQYIDKLAGLNNCTILLSGYQVATQSLQLPANVLGMGSLEESLQFVENLDTRKGMR